MPPFLARSSDRIPAAVAAQPAPVAINMANLAPVDETKPKVETLFGPPVGVGGTAPPEWTVVAGKEEMNMSGKEEELTMDVVQEWVKRSKEESATNKPVATTTLQALVNLKRPSIRLTPLAAPTTTTPTPEDPPTHAHGLEFDFDCDAARCAIAVRAVLPTTSTSTTATTSLFERIVDGGFGKTFKFDEHRAILELDKLDIEQEANNNSTATTADAQPASTLAAPTAAATNRKRFSAFPFRRRSVAAGTALRVVDADAEAAAVRTSGEHDHDEDHAAAAVPASKEANENVGVKVVIRLEALDEQDKPLASRNAQLTYLHIIRTPAPEASGSETEVVHPWVVKVVKREAVIGTHTFRLQEIYGLASSTSSATNAPAPTTYPPIATVDEAPATECVLCLSSPREVVLLPCRHLVACRECAVNMVEFGAGGALTHEVAATEATDATGDAATPADVTAAAADGTITTPAPVIAERPRRKRKAKGWFCPVCRQPYTALLRITTTPPGKRLSEDSFSPPPIDPPAAAVLPAATATEAESGGSGGVLSGLLSSLSLKRKSGEGAATTATPTGPNAV